MANFRGMRAGKRLGALGGLALVAALALAACGGAGGTGGAYGGGGSSSGGSSSVAVNLHCASGAVVCTKSVIVKGKATTALANADGMTLYYFTPDSATSATCNGPCALIWPPLTASSNSDVMGTSLSGALGDFHGANGEQVEYNGHPLYHYSGDRSQSDATGEGIEGKWFVATPSLQVGNAAPAAPTKTPGNGYGGGY